MRRKNVRKSRNDGGNHGKKEVVSKSSGEIKFGQDEIAKHELMRHRIDNSSNTPQEYDVSTKEQVKAQVKGVYQKQCSGYTRSCCGI